MNISLIIQSNSSRTMKRNMIFMHAEIFVFIDSTGGSPASRAKDFFPKSFWWIINVNCSNSSLITSWNCFRLQKRFEAVKIIFIAQFLLKSYSEFYFERSSTNLIVVNYVLKMISQLSVFLLLHPHRHHIQSHLTEPLLKFQLRTLQYMMVMIWAFVSLEKWEIIINLIVTNIVSSRSFYVPH